MALTIRIAFDAFYTMAQLHYKERQLRNEITNSADPVVRLKAVRFKASGLRFPKP